jgi:hypothetical protein
MLTLFFQNQRHQRAANQPGLEFALVEVMGGSSAIRKLPG